MKWPFRKKPAPPALIQPPPCKHKYQDFPWYMEKSWNSYYRRLQIKIIEPYVCIYCHQRKNVTLLDDEWSSIPIAKRDEIIEIVTQKYSDHLQPKAIVEDMVNDMQLVDRQWLEIANQLRIKRGVSE